MMDCNPATKSNGSIWTSQRKANRVIWHPAAGLHVEHKTVEHNTVPANVAGIVFVLLAQALPPGLQTQDVQQRQTAYQKEQSCEEVSNGEKDHQQNR